jgi:hypothetical protein
MACSRPLQRYWSRSRTYHRPHVSLSAGFPSGLRFLGNPPTVSYPVDTCSSLSTTRGYSVPHRRLSLCVGPHSSPGFSGVYLGRMENRPALIRAILAQANNPRRLVQPNDDSDMGSSACPCTALLDGIPSRILSDRLLSPLLGLMVSRYPRGYAFTSTPKGQELHLHGAEVIKDPVILTLYPRPSCVEGRFRETDRTSTGLLGAAVATTQLLFPTPSYDRQPPPGVSALRLHATCTSAASAWSSQKVMSMAR